MPSPVASDRFRNATVPPGLPPQPHPNVVAKRLGDVIVLVHLDTNRVYELNSTAARLWELCDAGCDLAQILVQMSEEFDVQASQLRTETETMLALFLNNHLMSLKGA
jgi:hypothetical protein